MRKLFTAFVLFLWTTSIFADNFNSISIQGKLSSATPINNVTVKILSSGQPVSILPDTINLIPDAMYVFSVQITVPDPKVFLTGSDYAVSFSTPDWEATFPITGVPFALTVRGDAQTGNQNVFGAYGNVGIGTSNPTSPLVISSAATTTGNMFTIAIGTLNVISMTGTGDLSAKSYKINDAPAFSVIGGTNSYGVAIATPLQNITGAMDLFIGPNAGLANSGENNTFIGAEAGTGLGISTGCCNTYIGRGAGHASTSGRYNTFVGDSSGIRTTTGQNNVFIGEGSGKFNVAGHQNIYIGNNVGYENQSSGGQNIIIGNDPIGNPTGQDNNYLNIGNIIVGDIAGSSVTIKGDLHAANFYGDGSHLSNVVGSGDNLGDHIATTTLNMNNYQILNVSSLTVNGMDAASGYSLSLSSGIYMPAGTVKANGAVLNLMMYSPKVIFTPGGSIAVSSESLASLGGGVRISSNVYVIGFASATKFFGDGSGLTNIPISMGDNLGNHIATTTLDMATFPIANVSSLTVTGNAFSVGGSTLVVTNGIVSFNNYYGARYIGNGFSVLDSSWTAVQYNYAVTDPFSMYSTITNRLTVPVAGFWCFNAYVGWQARTGNYRWLTLQKNSTCTTSGSQMMAMTQQVADSVTNVGEGVSSCAYLNANEYISACVFQHQGGTVAISSGEEHSLTWYRVSQ